MDKLTEARKAINDIDAEMARLFAARMRAVRSVAEYKKENGLPVTDSAREAEVISKASELIDDDELRSYFVGFLKNNMELSKKYQHRLLDGMRVAYSGVPGAFAHIAVKRIFPDANAVAYPSFRDAYRAVSSGDADAAVLPIENSTGGDVAQVLDLMFFGSLYAAGIYDLEVSQCLLGKKGAKIGDIKKVISHPQALAQCAPYIDSHGFETAETANTAVAAKSVSEGNATDVAAIASSETATLYGLDIIDRKINESSNNTTRFVVLTRAEKRLPSDKHFIMFFTVKNEAGALGEVVRIIGEHGFNMHAIKSRPTKELVWDYYFFVESEGSIASENGEKMIAELNRVCSSLKITGSFGNEILLKEETEIW